MAKVTDPTTAEVHDVSRVFHCTCRSDLTYAFYRPSGAACVLLKVLRAIAICKAAEGGKDTRPNSIFQWENACPVACSLE